MDDNTSAFCASEYDKEIRKVLPYYEDFYKQVVDIAKIQFDRPVTWLDIGCGTGKMADAAFKAVNIDKFVFCDNSERMLEIARNRFKNTRTQFILSSFLDLQLTIPFDVITAIQVFHYFQKEDRIKAIKKCYDNLSSNGIFIKRGGQTLAFGALEILSAVTGKGYCQLQCANEPLREEVFSHLHIRAFRAAAAVRLWTG